MPRVAPESAFYAVFFFLILDLNSHSYWKKILDKCGLWNPRSQLTPEGRPLHWPLHLWGEKYFSIPVTVPQARVKLSGIFLYEKGIPHPPGPGRVGERWQGSRETWRAWNPSAVSCFWTDAHDAFWEVGFSVATFFFKYFSAKGQWRGHCDIKHGILCL